MSSGNNNPNVNGHKQFAFDLNVVPIDDGNSDFSENSDPCTICLEPLAKTTNDHRTLVALNCNHKFHLDCIGSAFNAKSFMQCPYCMQIEPGQWRNAPNRPISDFDDDDMIVEDEDGAHSNMAMGVERCPYGSGQHYIVNTQRCPFIEYSFIFPESSAAAAAAGVDPNSIISEWITTARDAHNRLPPIRRIFWSLTGPGMMTGRHYLAHPSFDHTPLSSRPGSSMNTAPMASHYPGCTSVANAPMTSHFPGYTSAANAPMASHYPGYTSVPNAPMASQYPGCTSVPNATMPSNYPGCTSVVNALMASLFQGYTSVANAPDPPPYPNNSTMQPSLLGDSSASVFAGSMFSSGQQEVARGTSGSRPNLSGSNQVDENGFSQFNAVEAEPFSDLAEQFEIERQSYLAMYYGRVGENGGSDSDGEIGGSDSDGENGGSDSDGGNGGSDTDVGNGGSDTDGGNSSDNE